MPKLEGLIFDLDGTLVDSAPDIRNALNRTLVEQGRRDITLDEVKALVGDGLLVTLQRAFEKTGAALADDQSYRIFQIFVGYYRALKADPSQIYPGVTDALRQFRDRGVKLGVCTNKQETATHRILDELGLANYFTFVAGGDTYMVHKPHPDHVRGVAEAMAVSPAACVMVGDSANDVKAAKGAGMSCLMITHGYGTDVAGLGADGLIGSFAELDAALARIGFAS